MGRFDDGAREWFDDDAVEAECGGVYDDVDVDRSCRAKGRIGGKNRSADDGRLTDSSDIVADRFRWIRSGRC